MNDREKAIESLKKIGDNSTYHTVVGENGFFERCHDTPDISELPEYKVILDYLSKPSFDDAVKVVEDLINHEEEMIINETKRIGENGYQPSKQIVQILFDRRGRADNYIEILSALKGLSKC